MKKISFSLITVFFLTSCGNYDRRDKPVNNTFHQLALNSSISHNFSINVDLKCLSALPGNNDWNNKNIFVNQSNPLLIIKNTDCEVTINKYYTKNGTEYIPKKDPLIISIDGSGTGNSELKTYKNKDNIELDLIADATKFNIGIYEDKHPISSPFVGLVTYSPENLGDIFTVLNKPKEIAFRFSPTAGSLQQISLDISDLNRPQADAWSFKDKNSCKNITNFCEITLIFNPKNQINETKLQVINISYNNGSIQKAQIPIKFSTKNLLSRSSTPVKPYNEALLLAEYLAEQKKLEK